MVPSATPGPVPTYLNAVSCTSAVWCVAVGDAFFDTGGFQTFVESWNGTSWATSPSPDTSVSDQDQLMGVSCSSSTRCEAVGNYAGRGVSLQTLIESYDGTSWSIVASPNGGNIDSLSSVSCPAGWFCVAVGQYGTPIDSAHPVSGATLIESFDGVAWSIMDSPDASSYDGLSGVSCMDVNFCVAVGTFNVDGQGGTAQTLVEQLVGTWTVRASPDTSSQDDNRLVSVSCPSITACLAVGFQGAGAISRTLGISLAGQGASSGG